MTQSKLTEIFEQSEEAKKKFGLPLDNGWGSSSSLDKDYVWDSNSDTHWERDSPDGEWKIVPPIGRGEFK